jgi:uncharacterized protein (TIGR00730 family)
MDTKKQICVFCGARDGLGEKYKDVATRCGRLIGQYGYDMVYGGSSRGLMGITAKAAKESGAKVTGIFPTPLAPSDQSLHLQEESAVLMTETCGTHDAKRFTSVTSSSNSDNLASAGKKYEVLNIEMHETIFVNNMFERKDKMFNMSDIFLTLPGGLGSIDEFFEVFTTKSLGWHSKEIILINTDNYWNEMIQMINKGISEEFASAGCKKLFYIFDTPELAFEYLNKEK